MRKETITYPDYNGVERTEDFLFNLTEAEAFELEMGTSGGVSDMISRIIAANDAPAIVKVFKEFLLKAYGEKSPDGKYFNKSEELSTAFSHTNAYSQLFMKLASDAKFAADFVNGVIPNVKEVKNGTPELKEVKNGTPELKDITNN